MATRRNKTSRQFILACMLAFLLSACVEVDGFFEYVVEGRLLYSDGNPVDGVEVSVWGGCLHPGNTITPVDGRFSETLYGGMWGGAQILMIPLYEMPVPDEIDSMTFLIQGRSTTIVVPHEKQARFEGTTRWVVLGDVQLDFSPE